jgi:hypothetical protein
MLYSRVPNDMKLQFNMDEAKSWSIHIKNHDTSIS